MTFAYKTETLWERPLIQEEKVAFDTKSAEFAVEGKTDGLIVGDPWASIPATVVRVWSTEEAAQEWKDYCHSFVPPPASTEIKPNN